MTAKDFIKFQKWQTEMSKAIDVFQEIRGFPQVFVAINRSHIMIVAPKNDPNDYYNRK